MLQRKSPILRAALAPNPTSSEMWRCVCNIFKASIMEWFLFKHILKEQIVISSLQRSHPKFFANIIFFFILVGFSSYLVILHHIIWSMVVTEMKRQGHSIPNWSPLQRSQCCCFLRAEHWARKNRRTSGGGWTHICADDQQLELVPWNGTLPGFKQWNGYTSAHLASVLFHTWLLMIPRQHEEWALHTGWMCWLLATSPVWMLE